MQHTFRQIAERLSAHAEAVCAYYLSNGRKNGRYWTVGNVQNDPGASMWVRLTGPSYGPGAAGKWSDEATGQHGDLIDLIALNRGLADVRSIREEVLTFLNESRNLTRPTLERAPRNSTEAARRLFKASKPARATLAEAYLHARGITLPLDFPALRFHPGCYYRGHDTADLQRLPALIAGVTSLDGNLTGLLRIYLAEDGKSKAPVSEPKLAMGNILGNGIRLGVAQHVMVAGEGLETMLALKTLLPSMPMVAAVSAGHLGALILPRGLARLYIAMEDNRAGRAASERLAISAIELGARVHLLRSAFDDWNSDLQRDGHVVAQARLVAQLAPPDVI